MAPTPSNEVIMHPLIKRTESQLKRRSNIDALENALVDAVEKGEALQIFHDAATPEGQDEVEHYFAKGVYGRGVLIPAGTTAIGRLYKQTRICVVASGLCTFTDEFGSRTVEAPWVGEFRAGTKTAVFAHEDTYWIAFLGTELTDPDAFLRQLTTTTHADYEDFVLKADNEKRQ